MDSKYSYSEEDIPKEYITRAITYLIPRHVEVFFEKILAKLWGLKPVKMVSPKMEIDITLLKFQKVAVVGEVKWVNKLHEGDIRNIEQKFENFPFAKKLLILPDKDVLSDKNTKLEIITPKDVIYLVLNVLKSSLLKNNGQ